MPWREPSQRKNQKPEPRKPEVQKPAKKNSKLSSVRDEREKKIKEKIRDHQRRLAGGVHFIVLVESWRCDYSFGINSSFNPLRRCKDKWDSMMFGKPFDEDRSLVFIGKFIEPPQLKEKNVEVHLKQSSPLNEEERDKHLNYYSENPPHSVGSLSKEKSDRWCFLDFPEDAFNIVLAAALGNKIKIITFRGETTRYGRASIFEFSLREKVEDDE
jgi:hypothetical protein